MESMAALLANLTEYFRTHPAPTGRGTSLPEMNTPLVCGVCNGLGSVRRDVPYDHPNFGKVRPCPACYKPDFFRRCGVPLGHRQDSFSSFDLTVFRGAGGILKTVQSLALGSSDFHLILLLGQTGVGKTHLLYAATLAACGRGIPARYITEAALLSDVKQHMDGEETPLGRMGYEAFWRAVQRWPFLCLDGMADTRLTDWGWAMLDELVDTRYTEGLPLIAASNCSPDNLPPRMLSRFRDNRYSRLLWLDTSDYRLRFAGKEKAQT